MFKLQLSFIFLFSFLVKINVAQEELIHGNIIVMTSSASDIQRLCEKLKQLRGTETELKMEQVLSSSLHIYLLSFNANAVNENELLNALKINSLIKIAQFNYVAQERVIPNDAQFGAMWDMNNTGQNGGTTGADIDALNAWNITTGGVTAQGDTIVVAVVDGGFEITHQDLNFFKNHNEIPNNNTDDDNNGYIDDVNGWNVSANNGTITAASHGTHVSGTVGAKGNNNIGVTGVNWNVKVLPVMCGNFTDANVAAAYAYVYDMRNLYNQTNGVKGAFVVSTNSSFGIDLAQPSAHPLWCAMYDTLGSVGILSACATANHNYNIDVQGDIPTACTSNWMIAVTNTQNDDTKYPNAGYGTTTIDLGAPGTNITSTDLGNTYSQKTGTSQATPHVAGAIALMYSVPCIRFINDYKANPAGVALMVKDSLLNATDANNDLNGITVSGGRLNIYKPLLAIENYCTTTVAENSLSHSDFEIVSVFPNPAANELNVRFVCNKQCEIIIADVLGQEIKRIVCNTNTTSIPQVRTIDLTNVSKGVYFLSISTSDKKYSIKKIVKY